MPLVWKRLNSIEQSLLDMYSFYRFRKKTKSKQAKKTQNNETRSPKNLKLSHCGSITPDHRLDDSNNIKPLSHNPKGEKSKSEYHQDWFLKNVACRRCCVHATQKELLQFHDREIKDVS